MSVGKLNVNLLDLSRAADDYAELQTAAAAISPQAWIGNGCARSTPAPLTAPNRCAPMLLAPP